LDCAYIIHKNEGRLFLLGRNGYYNKLVEDLYPKLYGRLSFVLINNQNTENDEIMEKLVMKADQGSLKIFQNENKFFFVTEEIMKNLTLGHEISSFILQFCFQQFSCIEKNCYLVERMTYVSNKCNADSEDKYLIRTEGPQATSEVNSKIKSLVDNVENGKTGSKLLCFML